MQDRSYFVYILASKPRGVLYVGFSGGNLAERIWAHKNELVDGFTKRYHVHKLVYYEVHEDRDEALKKEKQIKRWHREWKFRLIEKTNPNWDDLFQLIQ